ncbi:hypothetical protein BD410DRAFT_589215 [Rickenella mellea]|uniref:Uncharacterized protein n=1 Tax=Rickenella mellea TaxID=50990 RepID=A0A4Y7PQU1_9AGAM|nr:hypothetical protein BD410DRAFT_589215 [Rickenella mellea]
MTRAAKKEKRRTWLTGYGLRRLLSRNFLLEIFFSSNWIKIQNSHQFFYRNQIFDNSNSHPIPNVLRSLISRGHVCISCAVGRITAYRNRWIDQGRKDRVHMDPQPPQSEHMKEPSGIHPTLLALVHTQRHFPGSGGQTIGYGLFQLAVPCFAIHPRDHSVPSPHRTKQVLNTTVQRLCPSRTGFQDVMTGRIS